ncbi:Uncharacterised protein [Pseudomonas putida]|nr:Uncharacterised protein [Pseudomonas putida]CAB5575745.1 Uncharacterised protein [Pseudomonas putida]CAB5619399.1 Uncharacterised protein [Pseudomonas putida]CAB5619406.1 Uncharacterised protein [Pseudomonas putida]CAB5699805.1 Uncharacterised protein [Pseudomonas putida]
MRSTQVAGKYDTRAAGRIRFTYIALDIGRTEQMPGALQPDAAYESFSIYDGVPLFEGYGGYQFREEFQVSLDLGRLGSDAELIGIFQHQG